jgi:Mg2+ and Co2+ transporter CorA
MNREEIIRMAREADFKANVNEPYNVTNEWVFRFAALVASAERERIKQANAPEIERINAHIKELEDAVVAEREACAKMLEAASKTGKIISCTSAAKAIRSRGQA